MVGLIAEAMHHSINRLEYILDNWDTLADAPEKANLQDGRITVRVDYGLCHNCRFHNLPYRIQGDMFEKWPDYSGDEAYPVDSIDEYDIEYKGNKFKNPQRRYLAEHCLQYLKDYLANE